MNMMIDWQKILEDLDKEHPPIVDNHYRYLYVGDREYIYDVNTEAFEPEPQEKEEDNTDYNGIAEELLSILTPQEKQLVQWILYDGKTYAFCGRHYGCTRQNIRYLYKRAMAKMKNHFTK